jgi:hypothetical protein
MKKFIPISAVLSLVFAFSVVAASAQTAINQFEASIPFAFSIGNKNFEAGTYTLKINRFGSNTYQIVIEDKNKRLVETVHAASNGDVVSGEPRLVFNKYDNQRFLAGIRAADKGLAIPVSRTEKDVAKRSAKPKTIALNSGN